MDPVRGRRRSPRPADRAWPGGAPLDLGPYSAHLAAFAVARSERVPWVAELRDPWTLIDDEIRPRSRARKAIDVALERRAGRRSERDGRHLRADPGGDGAGLPGALLPSLGSEKRIRADRRPGRRRRRAGWPRSSSFTRDRSDPRFRSSRCCAASTGSPRSDRAKSACGSSGHPSHGARRPGPRGAGLADPRRTHRSRHSATGGCRRIRGRRPGPGEANRQHVAAKLMDYLGARRPVVGIISASGEMARLAADYGTFASSIPTPRRASRRSSRRFWPSIARGSCNARWTAVGRFRSSPDARRRPGWPRSSSPYSVVHDRLNVEVRRSPASPVGACRAIHDLLARLRAHLADETP